jgi:adenosylmethionine-8-amino-7-oxononanoate aminotransferase
MRNLGIIEDEHLVERAAAMGRLLNEGLARLAEMPHVGDVRGLGLMAAVEVVADKGSRAPYDAGMGIGGKLARAMRDRGLVTRVKGESILLAPPLIVSEGEIDSIIDITAGAIDEVCGEG